MDLPLSTINVDADRFVEVEVNVTKANFNLENGITHEALYREGAVTNCFWVHGYEMRVMPPNPPSSASRHAGRHNCNRDAHAGFAAAHRVRHFPSSSALQERLDQSMPS